MSRGERAGPKAYGALWRVLASVFRVPGKPPTLPARDPDEIESFRPAPGFLRYLKFWFWLALLVVDGVLLGIWIVLAGQQPLAGAILLPVFLVIAIVPDVLAWVAVHLRFDTTWYVLSDRSLRIRRGILLIRETTITFENVQNVKIKQGPLQRHFEIANLIVETAGGGGGSDDEEGGAHVGLVEGVADATRIRDRILDRAKRSRGAGLGDDEAERGVPFWGPEHVACLRAIRNEVRALAGSRR